MNTDDLIQEDEFNFFNSRGSFVFIQSGNFGEKGKHCNGIQI